MNFLINLKRSGAICGLVHTCKVRSLIPGIATLMLGCGAGPASAGVLLRVADTHPSDYPTVQALLYMGALLEQWPDSEIRLKIYAGGQLGEEKDTLELTVFGGIDINRVNLAPLNSIVDETIVLAMPFLFRSIEHMRMVVDGPIGDEILDAFEEHGLIGLAYYDSGARSFYNSRRPIRTPADLAGMKIRVQNSDLFVELVAALGGNPTPMGFGQVYESLVLGAIDGSENNWPSYESTRHFEAAPFYSLTQHTMTPEVLVMSKHRWDKLTEEQQTLLRRAARASVAHMRELWEARVEQSREAVLAAGVEVIEDIDKGPFIKAVAPLYDRFLADPELKGLAERIQAVSE